MSSILKKKAEEIRDEVRVRANTSKKVGGLLVDIVERTMGCEMLTSISEYNSIISPDSKTLYVVIENGLITHVFLGRYSFPVAGGSEITKENFTYELPLTLG
jgi:hypothetical protein|nr:MAG TPA: hypothetical protein [Caudoviricetes sp.]